MRLTFRTSAVAVLSALALVATVTAPAEATENGFVLEPAPDVCPVSLVEPSMDFDVDMATLEAVDPVDYLRVHRGSVVLRDAQVDRLLSSDQKPALEYVIGDLNRRLDSGHIRIGSDFTVALTDSGLRAIEADIDRMTSGCGIVTRVETTWKSTHIHVEQTCSMEEMVPLFPELATIGGPGSETTKPIGGGAATQGFIDTEPFGCALAVVGLAVAASAVIITLAVSPVITMAVRLLLGGAAVGGVVSYVNFVRNCTGVLAVRQEVGDVRFACSHVRYRAFVWSDVAGRSVPTGVVQRCNAFL